LPLHIKEKPMNRRSFLTALFGGVAATAVGSIVASEASKASELPVGTVAALDETPAEFSQYHRAPQPLWPPRAGLPLDLIPGPTGAPHQGDRQNKAGRGLPRPALSCGA
jgi:hypothetical protein